MPRACGREAAENSTLSQQSSCGQTANLGESLGSAILDHFFHRSLVGLYRSFNTAPVVFNQITNRKNRRKGFIVGHNNPPKKTTSIEMRNRAAEDGHVLGKFHAWPEPQKPLRHGGVVIDAISHFTHLPNGPTRTESKEVEI